MSLEQLPAVRKKGDDDCEGGMPYVLSSSPFPTFKVATFSARREANSAYTEDCTKILFAQIHVCPLPRNLDAMVPNR